MWGFMDTVHKVTDSSFPLCDVHMLTSFVFIKTHYCHLKVKAARTPLSFSFENV